MENGLTKFTDITAFRPSDTITRAEASKFVVSYAELLGLEKGVKSCGFSDTVGFDVSLIPFIQDSCLYGLFRGNNGKFRVNRKNSVLLLVPKSDPKCYK